MTQRVSGGKKPLKALVGKKRKGENAPKLTDDEQALYERVLSTRLVWRLPKHRLGKLMRECTLSRKERFSRCKSRKYGTLSRTFSDEEISRFFDALPDEKSKAFYGLIYFTGMRIGEAETLKIENIRLAERILIVRTEKSLRVDRVKLVPQAVEILARWMRDHPDEIKESGGYVFFNEPRWKSMQRTHIDKNHMRNLFRRAAEKACINSVYAESTELGGRTPRKLRRLTPHSFRHTFAGNVYRAAGKDITVVQHALRHTSPKSTFSYLHANPDDVDAAISKAFAPQGIAAALPTPEPQQEGEVEVASVTLSPLREGWAVDVQAAPELRGVLSSLSLAEYDEDYAHVTKLFALGQLLRADLIRATDDEWAEMLQEFNKELEHTVKTGGSPLVLRAEQVKTSGKKRLFRIVVRGV